MENQLENAQKTTLVLEPASEVPLYLQIRDQIILAIAEGHLTDGSPLPTTRQLALDFGINFHTVNKAYDLLRQEGFVRLTRKQGSFVRFPGGSNSQQIEDWQTRLRSLLAEALARGLSLEAILNLCKATINTFPEIITSPAEE
jgi:DNA-binding transcriptional regulator YhcF (GntR family)